MQSSSMILILLLSSLSVAGQSNAGSTSAVFAQPPASQSCPVRFSADRLSVPALRNVDKAAPSAGQGLEINFSALPTATVVKADVTVHGTSAGLRMSPAALSAIKRDDAVETFQLTASEGKPLLQSSIWTTKIAIVSWVELTHVEYADGTTWQASPESRCAAAPSLFVLVNAR